MPEIRKECCMLRRIFNAVFILLLFVISGQVSGQEVSETRWSVSPTVSDRYVISNSSDARVLQTASPAGVTDDVATLYGQVTDATNGMPIDGAIITVAGLSGVTDYLGNYAITNVPLGSLDAEFFGTQTSGPAPLSVWFIDQSASGVQTVSASADGYTQYVNEQVVIASSDSVVLDISLSPVLTGGELRMVLNWGEYPWDLDAHLITPGIGGDSHHVYWLMRGSMDSPPYAILDHDDVWSYGPETITLYQIHPGIYEYFVYDFDETGEIAGCGAVVQIYDDGGLLHTLQVPKTGTGNYWKVCEINGSTGDITIFNRIEDSTPPGYWTDSRQKPSKPDIAGTNRISAGDITSWAWDFGDGNTSEEQHPVHTYTEPGEYTVTLEVSDGTRTDTEVRTNYISVSEPVGVRLSDNAGNSGAPMVAASGDTVCVVWHDDRTGSNEIYLARSLDGGTNWDQPVRLTEDDGIESSHPAILIDQTGGLHLAWRDKRSGSWSGWYMQSMDGGWSWTTPVDATAYPGSYEFTHPLIAMTADYTQIYMFWHDNRNSWHDPYFGISDDMGQTWDGARQLTAERASGVNVSVDTDQQGTVHAAWRWSHNGNQGAMYKRSEDYGSTWGSDLLMNSGFEPSGVQVAAEPGGRVMYVYSYGDSLVWRGSSDAGQTWSEESLVSDYTIVPRTAMNNGPLVAGEDRFFLTWQDERHGNLNREIYLGWKLFNSDDWWERRITTLDSNSAAPKLSVSNGRVHLVWVDHADGNPEIYYAGLNDTGEPATAIEETTPAAPVAYLLGQNYPNPFNPVTTIPYRIERTTRVHLAIYDARGRLVEVPVNGVRSPGNYMVRFDGTHLASGLYFYHLRTGELSEMRKMLLLK